MKIYYNKLQKYLHKNQYGSASGSWPVEQERALLLFPARIKAVSDEIERLNSQIASFQVRINLKQGELETGSKSKKQKRLLEDEIKQIEQERVEQVPILQQRIQERIQEKESIENQFRDAKVECDRLKSVAIAANGGDINSGSKLIDILILLAQNKIIDKLSDINLCRATNNNNAVWYAIKDTQYGPFKRTHLMYAAVMGNIPRLRFLLERGANPMLESNAQSALGIAAVYQKIDVINELWSVRGVVNPDIYHTKALFMACIYNREPVVKLMIDKGMDLNVRLNGFRRRIDWHGRESDENLFKNLTENQPPAVPPGPPLFEYYSNNVTALHIAAGAKNTNIVKLLLLSGANPANFDSNRHPPIQWWTRPYIIKDIGGEDPFDRPYVRYKFFNFDYNNQIIQCPICNKTRANQEEVATCNHEAPSVDMGYGSWRRLKQVQMYPEFVYYPHIPNNPECICPYCKPDNRCPCCNFYDRRLPEHPRTAMCNMFPPSGY
jgi:hypothetical protein